VHLGAQDVDPDEAVVADVPRGAFAEFRFAAQRDVHGPIMASVGCRQNSGTTRRPNPETARSLDGVVNTPVSVTPKNPAKRILPPKPLASAIVIVAFTALLYLIELVNLTVFHGTLVNDGIRPRTPIGLLDILWAPLLHANWAHLIGNTIPVVVFGFLAMSGGIRQWVVVTVFIWLISGLGVWALSGSSSVTIGASGVAFGWLTFLLVRGIFNRSVGQILVSLVLLFYWGSVLWGLLPGRADISWQGHLFGALAGILCAWLVAKASRPKKVDTSATTVLPGSLTP
jgi:membrane associated rhomboid family serine protease